MQFNRNGAGNKAFKTFKASHNWEAFDALPKDIKEVIWYGILNIKIAGTDISKRSCDRLREQLKHAKRMQSQSTRATYGADHPQAGITLADLGL